MILLPQMSTTINSNHDSFQQFYFDGQSVLFCEVF